MPEPTEPVYFVHITDSHIGPSRDYQRLGHYPLPCAESAVALINELPVRPDFVIHTGDIVDEPDPRSYRLAETTFSRLNVPIYYVNGNHDRAVDIRHFLPMGPRVEFAGGSESLAYAFDVKGYRFLVLDGRGPDEITPHGILSEAQLALLRQEAQAAGPPLTIFVHFPALPMDSPWMDENMLLINGMAFHEALRPAANRLRGIFYGHVHQHMQTFRDGLLYVSAASLFAQLGAWPSDINIRFYPERSPGFNFVHLLPAQTIIHQHSFPRLTE